MLERKEVVVLGNIARACEPSAMIALHIMDENQKVKEMMDDAGEPAPEDFVILKNCHIS